MDCSIFIAGYTDYDDSLLRPADEAAYRAHLEACAACARYDRVLRKGRMLARQVATDPSRDFVPRLEQRIFSDPRPPLAPLTPAVAGGFLTLMLAAVTGLWVVDSDGTTAGSLALGDETATAAESVVTPTHSIPVTAYVATADWTAERVDRRVASSYSPLVIGPPAYRADRPVSTGMTSTTRRTLD